MGDAERDIFWLGTALQSLLILGNTDGLVKGRDSISEILGETIATFRRVGISGNLLTEIETWSNHFRDNYGERERIRQEDKDRFVANCQNWIKTLLDLFKERFAHPKELYDRLPKIDLICDAITQIQTAEHQFVCTSPDTRQIKEKVTEAIDASTDQDEILLTGYFDNALVDKLIRALRRGVQVRLIVPLYRPNERDNINATRRVKKENGLVRQHETNHARLMVFGNSATLVSSADPKTDGLDQNYEAGIWTTNRTLVQQCKNFFDVLWNKSAEWNM
ncbi:MAG: phospholipase D family protein [Candidatus Bathyarchaeia archaeon]|nr:phospholipase D family protein [Candidatus Bathyarchaeia archaeon]